MAQQVPHIIDLRRSYVPQDPNTFPATLHATQGEDSPEERIPVIPYDGQNFMPTPVGYCSFFGTNGSLGIGALAQNVDEIFTIQTNTFVNISVALCENGIWTKDLSTAGAWTQAIVLSAPAPGTHKNWSWCVIDQDIYFYRQNEANYWRMGPVGSYAVTAHTPVSLTMAGQLGIFKAGGRLGFWDSENSIAWSSYLEKNDFTPSLDTLAGAAIFEDIVGRIVVVHQHGDGFIIYATRSIVHVVRNVEDAFLFRGRSVFNNNGISYRGEVCFGDPDTRHFVVSTTGFCEINNGAPEFSSPQVSTYLKQSRQPVYPRLVNGRYLFFQVMDPLYSLGVVNFEETETEGQAAFFAEGLAALEEVATTGGNDVTVNNTAIATANQAQPSLYISSVLGLGSYAEATVPASVPIWKAHYETFVPLAELAAFAATDPDTLGNPAFFAAKTVETRSLASGWTGSAVKIGLAHGSTFPAYNKALLAVARIDISSMQSLTKLIHTEEDAEDFFEKQNFLWALEEKYQADYKIYMQTTFNTVFKAQTFTRIGETTALYGMSPGAITGATQTLPIRFRLQTLEGSPSGNGLADVGIFELSSTTNKRYGVDEESQWAQRNIRNMFHWRANFVCDITAYSGTPTELSWTGTSIAGRDTAPGTVAFLAAIFSFSPSDFSSLEFLTYASIPTNAFTELHDWLTAKTPAYYSGGLSLDATTELGTLSDDVRSVILNATFNTPSGVASIAFTLRVYSHLTYSSFPTGFLVEHLLPGSPVYSVSSTGISLSGTFTDIEYKQISIPITPVGRLTEEGYTQITGHGHYEDDTFVPDDTTDEPPTNPGGYAGPPAVSDTPEFNDTPLIEDPYPADGDYDVVIDEVPYQSGDGEGGGVYVPPIPPTSSLIQSGSIEPIYPTFTGAFVFDLHYKKWGKMVKAYKNLVDIFPINNMAGAGIFPYDTFNPRMGCRLANGTFPIFDQFPSEAESFIKFGKFGTSRRGLTTIQELVVHHSYPSTGRIVIEPSLDGKNVSADLVVEVEYDNTSVVHTGINATGRWHNIIFRGYYDLVHLELRDHRTGKR